MINSIEFDLYPSTTQERIKECRTNRNMTQKQLAEAAGFTPQFIGALEQKKKLTTSTARILAKMLGVRMEYLLCEDNFKTEEEAGREMDYMINSLPAGELVCLLAGVKCLKELSAEDKKTVYVREDNATLVKYPLDAFTDFVDEIIEYVEWRYKRFSVKAEIVEEEEAKTLQDQCESIQKRNADKQIKEMLGRIRLQIGRPGGKGKKE